MDLQVSNNMAILTYSMTPQRRQILSYLSVIRVVRQSETIIFTEPWIYRWLSARLQNLNWDKYVRGLVQDCSISIALALEILHWTIDICMIVLKGTSNIDRYQTATKHNKGGILCIILLMQCNAMPLKLYVVVKKMFSLNHEFIFTT